MRVKRKNCIREVTKVYLSDDYKITFTDEKKFTGCVQIKDEFTANRILDSLVVNGYYDFDFDDTYDDKKHLTISKQKKARGKDMMDYNNILEMDNITLQDCLDMYRMKGMCATINDGKVTNFVKEEN